MAHMSGTRHVRILHVVKRLRGKSSHVTRIELLRLGGSTALIAVVLKLLLFQHHMLPEKSPTT